MSLFLCGELSYFRNCSDTILSDFDPLSEHAIIEQTLLLDLLKATVCSSPYEIVSPVCDQLMSCLLNLVFQCSSDSASNSACRCLAGLINRRPPDAYLDNLLEQLRTSIEKFSNGDRGEESPLRHEQQKILNVCVWVTKSLVLRNHPLQFNFLQFIVDSLADSQLAAEAANGFKLILSDDAELMDYIFSATSHANITLMYRQRFFTVTFPQLLERYDMADGETKHFYVLALTQLIQFVPKEALAPEIPRLLPVLIQSLMSENPSLWLTTVGTLAELAADNPETLHSYIGDLLPRLLTMCAFEASMKVRIAALRCIARLASMPAHLILPQQRNVLHCLGQRLDDHKRLVRQEAAAARCKWYLVG
jgi:DNA repair/transcription protein MET18/MMS19